VTGDGGTVRVPAGALLVLLPVRPATPTQALAVSGAGYAIPLVMALDVLFALAWLVGDWRAARRPVGTRRAG
jgi:hypothetical protein